MDKNQFVTTEVKKTMLRLLKEGKPADIMLDDYTRIIHALDKRTGKKAMRLDVKTDKGLFCTNAGTTDELIKDWYGLWE